MAVISRGQITIVDLNDGKSINLYLVYIIIKKGTL